VNLLISILRAGRENFNEARRLQGTRERVLNGQVSNSLEIGNDPRIVEGMVSLEGNGKRRYVKNNRLSDDYLKSVFGV
jgi:hypothetical protein